MAETTAELEKELRIKLGLPSEPASVPNTAPIPAIKLPVSLVSVETGGTKGNRQPPTPSLTEENATAPYAVQALAEAKNGNLDKLVFLAGSDWRDNEDVKKAIALFDEAAYSSEPHWLTEVVYSLALREQTAETMFLQMEILTICPFFHFKILSRLSTDNAEISKINNQVAIIALTKLKEIREARLRGSDNTNRRYRESRAICIKIAADLWQKDPSCLKKDMVIAVKNKLQALNQYVPQDSKIREWLDEAVKNGDLAVPPAASNGGRPTK